MKIPVRVKVLKDIPYAKAGTVLPVLNADTRNARVDVGPPGRRDQIDTKFYFYLSDITKDLSDFFEVVYE